MDEDSNTVIEEVQVKKKRVFEVDPVGERFYGARFTKFQRVEDVRGFLPAFKEFYYAERVRNPKGNLPELLQKFNTETAYPESLTFHPYPAQVKRWRAYWDRDIAAKVLEMKGEDIAIMPYKEVRQAIKTREGNLVVIGAPDDNTLEGGVRTLAGELMNDALQMLKDDQELEELYDDDTLIKRRNYVVNVFAHATKMVHGKAALLLKASEEKRNNAGFLISLISKASAGKMSDEEMVLLKGAYTPKQNVESTV